MVELKLRMFANYQKHLLVAVIDILLLDKIINSTNSEILCSTKLRQTEVNKKYDLQGRHGTRGCDTSETFF